MQLEGKRIIVTGAARGIGASATRAFVREGATVAALDVRDDFGDQAARDASAEGPGRAFYAHCDVSSRAEVEEAFSKATDAMNGLDALVSVAAVDVRAPAEEITDDDWDRTMNVNVRGTFLTNQTAFPYLRDAGGGRILNFASAAGLFALPGGAHYSASKGGIISWTRTVASEWGRHNITANAICPLIWTEAYQESRDRYTPEQLVAHDARMAATVALGGRAGDPDTDLAPVLVFLLGDGARFITAQIVAVDGGMTPLR